MAESAVDDKPWAFGASADYRDNRLDAVRVWSIEVRAAAETCLKDSACAERDAIRALSEHLSAEPVAFPEDYYYVLRRIIETKTCSDCPTREVVEKARLSFSEPRPMRRLRRAT